MTKDKLEKYDILINQFKTKVNPEDEDIEKIIDEIHFTLLSLFAYGLEYKKVIYHFFRKKKEYAELGLILKDVLQIIFLYVGNSKYKFEAALKKARKIASQKGNDYGNGLWYDNIFSQGNAGIVTRSIDKITRQKTLIIEQIQQQVIEEDILTTILDLLNYSIYSIMLAKGEWQNKENIEKYFDFLKLNKLDFMISFYKE